MNRHLFRQILNQWRSNIWLMTELMIVSVVLWYIIDTLYVAYKQVHLPFPQDTEHCYLIETDIIDSTSTLFKPDANADNIKNVSTLLDHIKHRREVEAACLVYNGMHPYSDYSTYNMFGYMNETDSLEYSTGIYTQLCTSQYPLVFRVHGINGETPEDLAQMLKEGKLLISADALNESGVKTDKFVNKRLLHENEWLTVGALMENSRQNTYRNPEIWAIRNVSVRPWGGMIAFRVKADMDKDIIPNLLADVNKYVSGNRIISSVRSFKDIKRNTEMEYSNERRNFIVVALFLMVNIFLGILGTFWFRTQQRTGEIAMRIVVGANSRQILGRIISEGMILLAIVTVPAVALDLMIAHMQLTKPLFEFISWERSGICIAVTTLIMAIMIVSGAMIPAVRAMRIHPAIALKDE